VYHVCLVLSWGVVGRCPVRRRDGAAAAIGRAGDGASAWLPDSAVADQSVPRCRSRRPIGCTMTPASPEDWRGLLFAVSSWWTVAVVS
jgi:hypothetical protein